VPHRHDLTDSSCVNNEIRTCNTKLMKYIKFFEHTVLETKPNRECFTSWIAPAWTRGKSISKQIALQISTILGKKFKIQLV
jgi:hypothetical protein